MHVYSNKMNNTQYENLERKMIPEIESKFKVKYLYFNNGVELYYFKRKKTYKNKLDVDEDLLSFSFKEMRIVLNAL